MNLKLIKDLVKEYSGNLTYTGVCPFLVPEDGVVYWEIEHGLSTSNVAVGLFDKEEKEVTKVLQILSPYKVVVSWTVEEEVNEGDYIVLVISGGASSGLVIDSMFSDVSMNAVRNSTITKAIHEINVLLHDFNSGEGVN